MQKMKWGQKDKEIGILHLSRHFEFVFDMTKIYQELESLQTDLSFSPERHFGLTLHRHLFFVSVDFCTKDWRNH